MNDRSRVDLALSSSRELAVSRRRLHRNLRSEVKLLLAGSIQSTLLKLHRSKSGFLFHKIKFKPKNSLDA